MKLSHWRQISSAESIVLGLLFGGGAFIFFVPVPILIRLGLAVGLLGTGGALAIQLHSQLQERQWRHFRRPLAAFLLGFALASLTSPMVLGGSENSIQDERSRERAKQLCLVLGLSDPGLFKLVDDLAASGTNTNRSRLSGEINSRVVSVLTSREETYFHCWIYFELLRDDLSGRTGLSPEDVEQNLFGLAAPLVDLLEEIRADRNPFLPDSVLAAIAFPKVAGVTYMDEVGISNLLQTLSQLGQTRLDALWDRLVGENA